jgi:hypothetical protein
MAWLIVLPATEQNGQLFKSLRSLGNDDDHPTGQPPVLQMVTPLTYDI